MDAARGRLPSAEAPLPARGNVLGVRVSICDYASAVEAVIAAARARRSLLVTAADVHQIIQARRDPRFGAALNSFDVITPDGQPVRWGLAWTGQADLRERVYGPTLMLALCARAAQESLPICLYGSRPATLERLKEVLTRRYPGLQVVAALPGRFRPLSGAERTADVRAIAESGAQLVFVGMGCPRQEWWAFHMRSHVRAPLISVGAAFDLHAGLVAQAPQWMQAHGLEWLFRLTREPKRLWRRYLLLTPRFLPLIALQALGYEFTPPSDLTDAERAPCPG